MNAYQLLTEAEMLDLGRRVHNGYLGNWRVDYPGRTHGYNSPHIDPQLITNVEMQADHIYGNSFMRVLDDWCDNFDRWCEENLT